MALRKLLLILIATSTGQPSCVQRKQLLTCTEVLMLPELTRYYNTTVLSLIGVRGTCTGIGTLKGLLPKLASVEVFNSPALCKCLQGRSHACGVDLGGCGAFEHIRCEVYTTRATADVWISLGVLLPALAVSVGVGLYCYKRRRDAYAELEESRRQLELSVLAPGAAGQNLEEIDISPVLTPRRNLDPELSAEGIADTSQQGIEEPESLSPVITASTPMRKFDVPTKL